MLTVYAYEFVNLDKACKTPDAIYDNNLMGASNWEWPYDVYESINNANSALEWIHNYFIFQGTVNDNISGDWDKLDSILDIPRIQYDGMATLTSGKLLLNRKKDE